MRYLDTTVFVYAMLYKDRKGDRARDIIRKAILEEYASTSCLTIDEVVWAMWRETKNKNGAIKKAKSLFEMGNLIISPITREDSYNSLVLMEKYAHLKPRDATHLAVALRLGADSIVSDDKDFDNIAEIKRVGLE
jgi:predicted nucleic acid-binding protein